MPGDELFRAAFRAAEFRFDRAHGGFGAAPKFPPSMLIRLLLRIHHRTRDARPLAMAESTLLAMARGGIYDHLGGGFARYSTDERWLVPHFEKMLYDNALLAAAYIEAYQLTGKSEYADVARETLDYVLNDMTSPRGLSIPRKTRTAVAWKERIMYGNTTSSLPCSMRMSSRAHGRSSGFRRRKL